MALQTQRTCHPSVSTPKKKLFSSPVPIVGDFRCIMMMPFSPRGVVSFPGRLAHIVHFHLSEPFSISSPSFEAFAGLLLSPFISPFSTPGASALSSQSGIYCLERDAPTEVGKVFLSINHIV